jgi:FkbM family methyltransferase
MSRTSHVTTVGQRARNLGLIVRELGVRAAITYLRFRAAERAGRAAAPVWLRSRCARHPLLCRSRSSDLACFGQIFLERDFRRAMDGLPNVRFIVDCGANVGYASAWLLSRYPDARLVALEPDPDNCTILRRNLGAYGGRAQVRQSAVWSACSRLSLVRSGFRDSLDWSRHVRAAAPDDPGDVEAVDLATVMRESGVDQIDLLKIDIEGAEAEVFAGDVRPWLGRVMALSIELHDERCRETFLRATAGENFEFSQYGELTICRRPQPQPHRHAC